MLNLPSMILPEAPCPPRLFLNEADLTPSSTASPLKVTVPLTEGFPEQLDNKTRTAATARTADARRAAQCLIRQDLRKHGKGPALSVPVPGRPGSRSVVAGREPVGRVDQVLQGEVPFGGGEGGPVRTRISTDAVVDEVDRAVGEQELQPLAPLCRLLDARRAVVPVEVGVLRGLRLAPGRPSKLPDVTLDRTPQTAAMFLTKSRSPTRMVLLVAIRRCPGWTAGWGRCCRQVALGRTPRG